MTCSDCIHERVCENAFCWIDPNDSNKKTTCCSFKLKSRYIELPCAVGDYVEWDNGLIKTLYCVRGYMCDDAGFRFILNDFSPVINHRNITRTLTKEEAEKALERSEGK